MSSKCQMMHIDRADEITVAREPAGTARPISVLNGSEMNFPQVYRRLYGTRRLFCL